MSRNNPSAREQVFLSAYSPSNKHKAKAAEVLLFLPNTVHLLQSEENLAAWLWYAVRVAHMNKGVSEAEFVANLDLESVDSKGKKQSLRPVKLDRKDPYNSLDLQAWLKYLGYGGSRALPQKYNQYVEDQDRVMEFFGIVPQYKKKGSNPHQLWNDYSANLVAATQCRNELPGHLAGNTIENLDLLTLMYYYDGWYNSFLPLAETVWEKQPDWVALLADLKGRFYQALGPVAYKFSDLLALAQIPADNNSVNLAHDLLTDVAKELTNGTMTYRQDRVTFCGDVSDFASDLKCSWNLAKQHLSGGVEYMLNCIYERSQALGLLDLSPTGLARLPLPLLTRLGSDGAAEAMLELGRRYRNGIGGMASDVDTAIYWYTKASAAETVRAEAFWQLGECMQARADATDVSRSKARAFMDDAAALGHPDAQVWVGLDCEKSNPNKAFQLFEQAANQMHPEGLYHLGRCFEQGIGTPPDEDAAISRYRAALHQGYAEAKLALALCLPPNESGFITKEATELLQELVDAADARAMCRLAHEYSGIASELLAHATYTLHSSEARKDAEDYRSKAEQLFRRAADSGYAQAWVDLGNHLIPLGVDGEFSWRLQDWEESLECYRKAAEAGEAEGYYQMGWVYCCNHGFHRMPTQEALGYFRKAANMGHANAMFQIAGCVLEHGVWNEGDEPLYYPMADAARLGHERAKLLTRVFEDHYPSEQACDWSGLIQALQGPAESYTMERYALAYCYLQRAEYGDCVTGDRKAALHWLELAAQDGSKRAMCKLYELTREENPAAAMAWLKQAADEGSWLAMRMLYWATCDSDPAGAAVWLRKAADTGDYGSSLALDCLNRGSEVRFCLEQDDMIPTELTEAEKALFDELNGEDD